MKEPTPAGKPKGRTKRRQKFLPSAIGITGGVALASVAFWFFRHQAEHVVTGRAETFDTEFLHVIGRHEGKWASRYLEAMTHLGSHTGILTAAGLTAIAMIRRNRPQDAWTVIISTGGALMLNSILKAIFQRQRPQELYRRIRLPNSHSFPSGHSLLAAATYPIVAHHLVQSRSFATQLAAHGLSTLIIVSVGFSRLYFRVHFPSDVLGGFAAGLGWLGMTSLSHTLSDRTGRRELIE